MFDWARISVTGGHGGRGVIAFRREKFVPKGGPSGGDGGDGGNVALVADASLNTLLAFQYKKIFRAPRGTHGSGSNRHGRGGEDLEVHVPVGTEIWEEQEDPGESRVFLGDLSQDGMRLVVAKGGRGGRGNARFVSSTVQEPLLAEEGEEGEHRLLRLELKLVADVGIVGLPNAGKSSLLATLTRAHPKVADYPFTTIDPVLGVLVWRNRTAVLVDIPGLIEGAHQGIGLGHEFLRHAERTRVLLHLVDGAELGLAERIRTVNEELGAFHRSLGEKPQIVVVNKIDVPGVLDLREDLIHDARSVLGDRAKDVLFISAVGHQGLEGLTEAIFRALDAVPKTVTSREAGGLPVIRPLEGRESGPVVVVDDEGFRITHARAVRMAAASDLKVWKARLQFRDQLQKMGVTRRLEEMGVKSGDKVRVADWEFLWE